MVMNRELTGLDIHAKLILFFYPLEIVPRCRDTQLQLDKTTDTCWISDRIHLQFWLIIDKFHSLYVMDNWKRLYQWPTLQALIIMLNLRKSPRHLSIDLIGPKRRLRLYTFTIFLSVHKISPQKQNVTSINKILKSLTPMLLIRISFTIDL